MSKLLLPDARFRSPTAVDGKADLRDEWLYSSIVLCHGAAGQQKMFTVPQGQAIPFLSGAGIAPTAAHQLRHSELTTNFTKAGEAGSALGDFGVYKLGLSIENAWYDAEGAQNGYGAGQQEINEILSKTFFRFLIAGKKQIEGATFMFPSVGGAFGATSTTEAAVTVTQLTNGWPGTGRKLDRRTPIMVARTDTVEGVFGVASSSSLVFSVQEGSGQASLIWCNLGVILKGDVR